MEDAPRKLELLAPARDAEVARQAILHGADAVYMGGPTHGARAAAGNSIADIAATVELAHRYDARVYVTLNTLIYDSELSAAERLVRDCYRVGVDALIVQDMGLLRMDIPPIALHASTQCDIRTPAKARFLAQCGFTQLVLPRELSLAEIADIRAAVPEEVRLEAFVHGALCVSYSGDCQASCAANGRSANRGECAQMCRMAYDLVDQDGNVLMRNRHLLSLRDLCRLDDLDAMARAGIYSFKIEGRLKDAAYVKNAVQAYRRRIDALGYAPSSLGQVDARFEADVHRAFNRGFTSYFLQGPSAARPGMANISTPGWVGQPVGTVVRTDGKVLIAKLDAELHNGDGLGYFTPDGQFAGFRLNRVEGDRLYPATAVRIPRGTQLYRNSDTKREAEMARDTAQRTIGIAMALTTHADTLTLAVDIPGRAHAVASTRCQLQPAQTPQAEQRRRVLAKLGDTPYRLERLDDELDPGVFVPASVLTALRREVCEALMHTQRATYAYEYRRPEDHEATLPYGPRLTYHDNVSNRLAEDFYRSHGATTIVPAFEVKRPEGESVVMTTRYCLRRELGACLKTNPKALDAKTLYLQNKAARYRLQFDCANCQMHLLHTPKVAP